MGVTRSQTWIWSRVLRRHSRHFKLQHPHLLRISGESVDFCSAFGAVVQASQSSALRSEELVRNGNWFIHRGCSSLSRCSVLLLARLPSDPSLRGSEHWV